MSGHDEIIKAKEMEEIKREVRSAYPAIDFPEVILEPIFYGRFNKEIIDNRRLVLDVNTGAQFDIVSEQYDLIPHEVAVHNMLKAIPTEFGKPNLQFHLWNNGARFRVEATFPDVDQYEIKPGDPVEPKIIQTNSVDRSTHYGLEFGAKELICSNGLIAHKSRITTKRRHVFGAQDISELSETLKEEMLQFSDQVDIWKGYLDFKVKSIEEFETIYEELPFSEKEVEKLLLLPLINHDNATVSSLIKAGNANMWDALSAGTQFAKHEITSVQREFDLETKLSQHFAQLAA